MQGVVDCVGHLVKLQCDRSALDGSRHLGPWSRLAMGLRLHTRASLATHEENALQILKRVPPEQLDPSLACLATAELDGVDMMVAGDDMVADDDMLADGSPPPPPSAPLIITEEINYDSSFTDDEQGAGSS